MEAPDKLFLHPNNKGDVGASWLKFSITNEDVCYIRKDALLEWANEMLQDTVDRLDFHGNKAFSQLLDKLNSM